MQDIDAITARIDSRLEDLARSVIRRHLTLDEPANARFLADPDGREQHQTRWHQWGILTHTRVFLRHLQEDVPGYLREWGVWEAVNVVLMERIDGVSKWDLLKISVLLHDIGKFGARTAGKQRFHFPNHEDLSGEIIRKELDLGAFGLTGRQVEYVALTAEDHFVLALVRKSAREYGGFDEDFLGSVQFRELALDIKRRHHADYMEVGILFLGDSLAKVDPEVGPDAAVDQYGINVEAARRYLEIVAKVST